MLRIAQVVEDAVLEAFLVGEALGEVMVFFVELVYSSIVAGEKIILTYKSGGSGPSHG